jgi:hypothetical protein
MKQGERVMKSITNFRLLGMVLAILLATSTVFCPVALAQNPDNPGNVSIISVDPQVPGTMSAALCNGVLCVGGATTYYYWVVAVYPGGSVVSIGPAVVHNSPLVTTATNFVNVNWAPITGAAGITYDVLRTTVPTWPGGIVRCGPGTALPVCLLHEGLSATTTTDNGTPALLAYYALATFKYPRARAVLSSNNRDYTTPQLVAAAPAGGTTLVPNDLQVVGKVIASGVLAAGNSVNLPTNTHAELWGGDTEVTDPAVLGAESLTNLTFAPGAPWVAGAGWVLAGAAAKYSHNAATTLTQPNAQMAIVGVPYRWYKFQYDVTAKSRCVACVLTITNTFASVAPVLDLKIGTNKVAYFKSAAGAATAAFVFQVTGSVATDTFTLNNVSLKQIIGGNLVVNGTITGGGPNGITVSPAGAVNIYGGITSTTGGVSYPVGNVSAGSLAADSLANGALTTVNDKWTRSGDFAFAANVATYTDATHTGTLQQAAVDQAYPAVGSSWYRFSYDVVSNTMVAGVVTITVSYSLAAHQLNMTLGTGHVEYFYSAVAPTDFIINVAGSSGGAFVLDNLSLKQVLGGEVAIAEMLTGLGATGKGIWVDSNGDLQVTAPVYNGITFAPVTYVYLSTWTATAGTVTWCSDCGPVAGAIAQCAAAGTGALAIKMSAGGSWACVGI